MGLKKETLDVAKENFIAQQFLFHSLDFFNIKKKKKSYSEREFLTGRQALEGVNHPAVRMNPEAPFGTRRFHEAVIDAPVVS